ncbi:hypothetical protein [Spartinivicinus ruber]|uniref:hypothetical protein n=1 Tax=Spartinivicinus ruber TaxID=2683272 RepID=UPI0013D7CE30|nr:hypothetical protein [Spartinivicinus ruber]
MRCVPINGVTFDSASKQAIQRIKDIQGLANALATAVSLGTVVNIFLGNRMVESSFTISTTDWEAFGQAMGSVPTIARREIEKVAGNQVLAHLNDQKQKEFWQAVEYGCQK